MVTQAEDVRRAVDDSVEFDKRHSAWVSSERTGV